MTAAKHGEQTVVQALYADADPVHAGRPVQTQAGDGTVVGVGLQRDLGHGLEVEGAAHGVQEGAHGPGGEIGGRSPAQEDGADRGPSEPGSPYLDLAGEGVDVGRYERLDPLVRVEVAVGALALAEGDVDVQRQRLRADVRRLVAHAGHTLNRMFTRSPSVTR